MKVLVASVLLFSLGLSVTANAEEGSVHDENKFYSSEFGAYVNAFRVTETGEVVELTPEEYESLELNYESEENDLIDTEENTKPEIQPRDSFRSWLEFVATSSTNYTGDPLKVTADIGCTSSKGCSIGYGETYTKSVAVTFGAATNTEKEAIKTSLGITYTSATAKTSSFTYHLKQGENGYIAFKPYKVKKAGYFKECYNQGMGCRKLDKTGYVRLPKKLSNGNADGIFYFVHR